MTSLTLRHTLSVLSKSSPFSVKTVSNRPQDELDLFKEWLYIEQEIEADFYDRLKSISAGEMIFLCGSSGDGKSEILTRYYKKYHSTICFHLDATHSFKPNQSAIETLDNLFDEVKAKECPLVLGINIGMLGNYSDAGDSRHLDVKQAMAQFLSSGETSKRYHFLDFEQYQKFQLSEDGRPSSAFAKQMMQRLTEPSFENPFFHVAKNDEDIGRDRQLMANYRLMGIERVQDVIITNLFKTRMVNDQFMTARTLLDFLHHLLTGDGYLFDNLYGGSDNELVRRIGEFDPRSIHTKNLDHFVLRFELGLADPEFEIFAEQLRDIHIEIAKSSDSSRRAGSAVRLFYLFNQSNFGNNYHRKFEPDFEDRLLERYADTWKKHSTFDGSPEKRQALRSFYRDELNQAIFQYANRNTQKLKKNHIFLGVFNNVQLAAPIELQPDYAKAQSMCSTKLSRFYCCMKIDNQPVPSIPININLFNLMTRLNLGYRPNKYDTSAVVLLDELIEQIRRIARASTTLFFYSDGKCVTAHDHDGEEIEIEGV